MSSLAHGSLFGFRGPGNYETSNRLLVADVPPESLAEEKEGMTSENFPRMPAPPALTPHPGTVLPALALPTEVLHLGHSAEWQPHQPHVASVYPASPPGCQPPVRKPADCAEKTESQCLCV